MNKIIFCIFIISTLSCPNDPYCLSCQKVTALENPIANICNYCQYSFFDESTGLCDTNIAERVNECESYKVEKFKTLCAKCQLGFVLDLENNKCEKCKVQNCINCNREQTCLACIGGLIPEELPEILDGLNSKCGTKENFDKTCLVAHGMDLKGKCMRCVQGYALNNMEDKNCVPSTNNCQVADSTNPNLCLECISSHFIKDDYTCEKHNSLSYFWVLAICVPVIGSLLIYGITQLLSSKKYALDEEEENYEQI